jgi:hypothetical protein
MVQDAVLRDIDNRKYVGAGRCNRLMYGYNAGVDGRENNDTSPKRYDHGV